MRTILILLFILNASYALPQTTEWAPIGAKWWWSVSDEDVVGEAYYYWEVVGKDSFEGEWVRVIQSDLFGYDSMVVPGYDTMFTFSRNDSVFLYHDYSGEYKLLYDFGAQIGDTIRFATFDDGFFNISDNPAMIIEVVLLEEGSRGSFKKGDVRLFRTKYIGDDFFYWDNWYYEGFGSTHGLLMPRINNLYSARIRCYYDENIEFHDYYIEHSTGEIEILPCEYYRYTPTKEVIWNSSELKLYPNPTSDFLQVEISTELLNVNYKIIDWMGSVKGKGRVEELSSSIDVAAFSPGIYILSVENEKEIYFQKFIVQ